METELTEPSGGAPSDPDGEAPETPPATRRRPPEERRAPRSDGIFVGLVIGLALIGAAYWMITSLHDWDRLQVCATSGRRDCGTGR
mgnify:CR=1 FL=1